MKKKEIRKKKKKEKKGKEKKMKPSASDIRAPCENMQTI